MNTTSTKLSLHTHLSDSRKNSGSFSCKNSENCSITHTDRQDRQPPPDFLRKNHQPDKSTDLSFGKEKSVNIAHFSDSTHSCYRLDDTETPLARSSFYRHF